MQFILIVTSFRHSEKGGSLKLLFIVPTDIVNEFEIQRYKIQNYYTNGPQLLVEVTCKFMLYCSYVYDFSAGHIPVLFMLYKGGGGCVHKIKSM